jgi:pyridoxamine--pyruvate transaminase
VAEAFRKRPDIKVVSLVHHDTPSGTINPAREIGKIVRDHDGLLLVDAVSSFGGMDIHPDDCFADLFVTGPGKCLGGAPGLTVIAMSDRAWRHIEANPVTPRASVLSLLDWKDAWRKDKPFPFTPSITEVNGLEAVVDLYLEEGPEAVWKRHALTSAACRAGVRAMGLQLWAASEDIASPTTTAVRVPQGATDTAIIDAARATYGVVFSVGRGDTLGKLIRIGHMGPVAEPIYATVAVAALGGALRKLGQKADVAAGIEAAMAVIDAA